MDRRAIEAARVRLERARAAAAGLGQHRSAAKLAWGEFLMAFGGFYAKLEQGAEASSESRAWYHARRLERADDELLNYLHHARNGEEHGIAPVTKEGSRSLELAAGATVQLMSDGVDAWHVVGGTPGGIKVAEPELMLSRVRDRHGSWSPPLRHAGKTIDPGLANVAEVALRYAKAMLEQAQRLSPTDLEE